MRSSYLKWVSFRILGAILPVQKIFAHISLIITRDIAREVLPEKILAIPLSESDSTKLIEVLSRTVKV